MSGARASLIMDSDRFRYVAEEWSHGWVLTSTPIQQGGLHEGFTKITETENVATVFSKYDALLVANLHSKAHGGSVPKTVTR